MYDKYTSLHIQKTQVHGMECFLLTSSRFPSAFYLEIVFRVDGYTDGTIFPDFGQDPLLSV